MTNVLCPVCLAPMPADEAPYSCRSCWDRGSDAGVTQEYEMRKARRAREIRAAADGGESAYAIARRFSLSKRQAHRYIATFTNDPNAYGEAHPRARPAGPRSTRSASPDRVAVASVSVAPLGE